MSRIPSGQEFAVKLWDETRVTKQPDLTQLAVLSELSALLKIHDEWHACDELDHAWCPLVQLHGIFVEPRGLLMEPRGLLMERVRPACECATLSGG